MQVTKVHMSKLSFPNSHQVCMGELDPKERWALKNLCFQTVVLEKTWQSLGLQGDEPWIFTGRIDAEAPILWSPDAKNWHWKRPWCWERLKAGGEGDNRGRDGWLALPTQWTWAWANSGSWWWTGKPGMLQSMGSQRVGHDWVTEVNWAELSLSALFWFIFLLFNFLKGITLWMNQKKNTSIKFEIRYYNLIKWDYWVMGKIYIPSLSLLSHMCLLAN